MRKMTLAALVASAVFLAAGPAAATYYNFNYSTDGKFISGSLVGTLASDNNTFNITGLNYFYVNGSNVPGSPSVVGTDLYIFGSGSSPVATRDLSKLDFTVTSGSNQSFIVGVGDNLASVYNTGVTELTTGYGGTGLLRNFNRASYSASISEAPEPAGWATMIAGFGAIGLALRRRKARVRFA